MRKLALNLVILLSLVIMQSCCSFQGSHDLGNNFTLLEGDKLEDRIIVFCSPKKQGCCKGGSYVIPTHESHYDKNGRYAEYVETAEFNDRWIIVKSIALKNKEEKYWIIDKNFELEERFKNWTMDKVISDKFKKFIQSKILGPLNFTSFDDKTKELEIDLKFEG